MNKNLEYFYKGFFIEDKVGNNEFSYEKRSNKKIYVPAIKDNLSLSLENIEKTLKESDNIAFSEFDYEESKEINCNGIENFLRFKHGDKDIYIFDNHNHSFFFILNYLKLNNLIDSENILYHFDQHKDTSKPKINFKEYLSNSSEFNIDQVFDYTNYYLNVGNFINPMVEFGIIDETRIIDSSYKLKEVENYLNLDLNKNIILDIDLDFFSKDMDYINQDDKIKEIVKVYNKSKIITICTSPYFIEFKRAKEYLLKIFQEIL